MESIYHAPGAADVTWFPAARTSVPERWPAAAICGMLPAAFALYRLNDSACVPT